MLSVAAIISISVGVLAILGVLFVISDVRSYNRRKEEVADRNRRRSTKREREAEMA